MLNKVIIMGRLTADVELKQTTSGISTCQFTVAVERNFAAQGQDRQTDFINVVVWRQTAEFVSKYFHKGSMICVEGTLRTRTYDDKRYPDVRHYVTEVQADQVYFTGEKAGSGVSQGNNQQRTYNPQPYQAQSAFDDINSGGVSIGDAAEFEDVIGSSDDVPF